MLIIQYDWIINSMLINTQERERERKGAMRTDIYKFVLKDCMKYE